MNNKDLIAQYVDTGLLIPEYQMNKLNSNLLDTYLRKRLIRAERGSALDVYEKAKLSGEQMHNYIEARLKKNYHLADDDLKYANQDQRDRHFMLRMKSGSILPPAVFSSGNNKLKRVYIQSILDKEYYLQDNEFPFASDEQKRRSVELKPDGYYLSDNEFPFASDKRKDMNIRVKMGHNKPLTQNEFQFASDEQKKEYIKYLKSRGFSLNDYEQKWHDDDFAFNLNREITTGQPLPEERVESLDDKSLQIYLNKRVSASMHGKDLEDYEFDKLNKEQLIKYISTGYLIPDEQIKKLPSNLLQGYIKKREPFILNSNNTDMSQYEFKFFGDETKIKILKRMFENYFEESGRNKFEVGEDEIDSIIEMTPPKYLNEIIKYFDKYVNLTPELKAYINSKIRR